MALPGFLVVAFWSLMTVLSFQCTWAKKSMKKSMKIENFKISEIFRKKIKIVNFSIFIDFFIDFPPVFFGLEKIFFDVFRKTF